MPARRAMYEEEIRVLDGELASLNALLGSLHGLRELEATLPGSRTAEEEMNGKVEAQQEKVQHACVQGVQDSSSFVCPHAGLLCTQLPAGQHVEVILCGSTCLLWYC